MVLLIFGNILLAITAISTSASAFQTSIIVGNSNTLAIRRTHAKHSLGTLAQRPRNDIIVDEDEGTKQLPFSHSKDKTKIDRRKFLVTTLVASSTVGSFFTGDGSNNIANAATIVAQTTMDEMKASSDSVTSAYTLPWRQSPINKRSGVTVFDAENKGGYNVAFVTYLSRFLLTFDTNCQKWWFTTKFPKNANADEIERLRINQFGSFAASVEVGLQGYEGPNGSKQLLEDLVYRYGTISPAPSRRTTGSLVSPDLSEDVEKETSAMKTQQRLVRSRRRHIALLFGLLEKTQPVQEVTKLLASVDNGGIKSVQLLNETRFDGYEIGKEPKVVIPPPPGGTDQYIQAEGRAIMKPTGRILRLDIVDGGSGYNSSAPPVITISPPPSQSFSGEVTKPAKAQARVATKGPKKGSIESIKVIDPGFGYYKDDQNSIRIEVSQPSQAKGKGTGAATAVLSPVLDMYVDSIEMTKTGTGYAIEKPSKVFLEQSSSRSGTIGTDSKSRQQSPEQTLAGLAYPIAEKSSFTAFQRDSDKKILELQDEFETRYNMKRSTGTVSGINSELPPLPLSGGKSASSAELLRLLPAGIGLEYDSSLKRYVLAADTDFLSRYPATAQQMQSNNNRLYFEYGPRGRSPIERDMKLNWETYARFALAGALCGSGVHLTLTPLDVVKTKVQVDPIKYPTIRTAFSRILAEEGPSTLFTGWLPTYLGNFIGGGTLYGVTEFFRRSLTDAAGVDAPSLEVPIILFSAVIASSLGAAIICPFEAVRIRTVSQPEYADNSVGVLKKMLKEEGVGSLVNAIPVFLARQLPYAMVKFTVFDLSTEYLFEAYPAAQEELKLSLLVSLIGGILGGTAAAIVSNPADAVISELKKGKSDTSPFEAVQKMVERSGSSAFFVGLPLRMVFYSLVSSMIFVTYDAVRFLLGIGADDLKLYLDVLGGSLSNNPIV